MNTVITVNLNGNAFQFDEAGYEPLRAYLDRAGAELQNNPDRTEITADLEQAIADKCGRFLTLHKSVVLAAEVDQIITEMGPVDGRGGEGREGQTEEGAQAPGSTASTDGARTGQGSPKRLYRIREGQMVGGVCNGLAAYFGVDVTIVRVLFVLIAVLTKGSFGGVYIILMVVIPEAKTPAEQAAATGMPFNAQEIVDRVNTMTADIQRKIHSKDWHRSWRHADRAARRAWRRGYPRWGYKLQRSNGIFRQIMTAVMVSWIILILVLWEAYVYVPVWREFVQALPTIWNVLVF